MALAALWLCSRWSLNSPVTFLCLTSAVNLPRAEKFWRHSEHRHATGFPSIFSTTINSGMNSASHNRNSYYCSIEHTFGILANTHIFSQKGCYSPKNLAIFALACDCFSGSGNGLYLAILYTQGRSYEERKINDVPDCIGAKQARRFLDFLQVFCLHA